MGNSPFVASPSGVKVATEFRDNLIIDRYDPIFATMRASKLKHLRSENSEDAVTWNVFRSLRQIDPEIWLPPLANTGLPGITLSTEGAVVVKLWESVCPPPGLLNEGDEGESEIDIIIEGPYWVWFIEAKYQSDISQGTTTRPTRNQILRNIDVGSYYAGTRTFFFSLLVRNEGRSPKGVDVVEQYKDLSVPRQLLQGHRPDELKNLAAISTLTWRDLGAVLALASTAACRPGEKELAGVALSWLAGKGIVQS